MKKRILVVSTGLVHPTITAQRRLKAIIRGTGLADIVTVCRVEGLVRLAGGGFDGVVLYFHRRRISQEALAALDRFVAGGGGLLAIHGASASFKKTPRYFDILGGRFTGHGDIEPYTVSRADDADPAFRVTEPFAVTDELYIHRYRDDVAVRYATAAVHGPEPVVWTHSYGKGRVCYVSLGHEAAVFTIEAVKTIITDALSYILRPDRGGKR
jgi:type 1 glutamine amidotransferase